MMNATQVRGITNTILGKCQEKFGKLLGNREQQLTGLQRQRKAKAETDLGNARELIKNSLKQMHRSKRAMKLHRAIT